MAAAALFTISSASPVDARNAVATLEASKALTAALPITEPANTLANHTGSELSKRALTHLYVCTDIDFQGTCQNLLTYTQECCKCINKPYFEDRSGN